MMCSLVPLSRRPDDDVPRGRHPAAVDAGLPSVHRSCWALPADSSSTCLARRFVRAALGDWCAGGDREVTEVAELLVSELVANAMRHGRGAPLLTLLLLRDDTLRCEVEDEARVPVRARGTSPHDPTAPCNQTAQCDEEGGRGLLIVDTLSRAWGVRPTRRGKAVWFELPVNP
ncbi:ATP-binding protein [Microbispora sp. NBC_01189]|uniref:ATP-binding protein n=1 Tax=unclassified Microbispora TaxID=2614687 RepID=UPI002E114BE1|nr:ATP-binding protein [Microbispora sp. NBC_01189]